MARLNDKNSGDHAPVAAPDRSAPRSPRAENNVTAPQKSHKSTSTAKQGHESYSHAKSQSQQRVHDSDNKYKDPGRGCKDLVTGVPRRQRALKSARVDSSLLLPLAEDRCKAGKAAAKRECVVVGGVGGDCCFARWRGGCGSGHGSLDTASDEEEREGMEPKEERVGREEEDLVVRLTDRGDREDLLGLKKKRGICNAVVVDLTSPAKDLEGTLVGHRSGSGFLEDGAWRSSRSLVADPLAVVRLSPHRLKLPADKASAAFVITPPASPTKSKLRSPTKLHNIPPLQHRPSIDAFWSQEVVNTWNDEYSPRKALALPRETTPEESSSEDECPLPTMSPRKRPQKSPVKKDRVAVEARKFFESRKQAVAESFLNDLDREITGGEVKRLSRSSGGIHITWNKKLNSTAGRANWRREAVRSINDDGVVITAHRHLASIELAEKVIDDEHRLLNVLAHEYCHLTNFMISNVQDQPHGASFKCWAARVTKAFAHRAINVTTKHSYDISYKYAWTCVNKLCGVNYTRHSKSIDPARHTCGRCKSRLLQTRPVPRGAGASAKAGDDGVPAKSEYQIFVKEHFRAVKRELGPASPMKAVMKEVGARYRVEKEEKAMRREESTDNNAVRVVVPGEEEAWFVDVADDDVGEIDKVSRVLDFLTI